tara:strand:+ start:1406 stop:1561 length:156 start_codon:yes stop_codon:yes gene_type:complete
MIEIVAQIFGMSFIGVIVVCLIWTIGNSIAEASSPNNKLEENIKKFEKKHK